MVFLVLLADEIYKNQVDRNRDFDPAIAITKTEKRQSNISFLLIPIKIRPTLKNLQEKFRKYQSSSNFASFVFITVNPFDCKSFRGCCGL